MIFDEACPVGTPLFIHPCCLVSMGFLLTFLHPPCTLLAPWVLVRARKVHGGCKKVGRNIRETYGQFVGKQGESGGKFMETGDWPCLLQPVWDGGGFLFWRLFHVSVKMPNFVAVCKQIKTNW